MDRRDWIKVAGGATLLLFRQSPGADGPRPVPLSSVGALIAAGLDPLIVYRRMFASADPGQGSYWCFAGPLTLDFPDVGAIAYVQEETFRAQRTVDDGPDAFYLDWREAGVFRDLQTGAVASDYVHPGTGEIRTLARLHHEPARFSLRRSGSRLEIQLDRTAGVVHGITIGATVDRDRVTLTHTEYKSGSAPGSPWQSATLQINSSLMALRGNRPSVPARGVYSVRVAATGSVFVAGVMQKASPDEKLNPLAWERIRTLYPDFFEGPDRVDVHWA